MNRVVVLLAVVVSALLVSSCGESPKLQCHLFEVTYTDYSTDTTRGCLIVSLDGSVYIYDENHWLLLHAESEYVLRTRAIGTVEVGR